MQIKQLSTGPIIKYIDENKVIIWGELKKNKNKIPVFVIRILKNEVVSLKYVVVEKDTMIGRVTIDSLANMKYFYQVSCLYLDRIGDLINIDVIINNETIWHKSYLYTLDLSNTDYSIAFGSCRRYISILGIPLFGTGKEGDKIYNTINKLQPKLFLSIGDQVYYDPIGRINRVKNINEMRNLNKKIKSFPNIKDLLSNVLSAEICDDHDIHCNNTNSITQYNDKTVFNNAVNTYYEYQHYSGVKTDPLWYSFRKKLEHYDISFFIMDTRTERNDFPTGKKMIIGDKQMIAIKDWIYKEEESVKFLVSSCPIISQIEEDSWYGYPEQQKELINLISMEKNIFILTGDAHCARIGVYEVSNLVPALEPHFGNCMVTEILSSGLVAVNHDHGKGYNILMDTEDVNMKDYGDFPIIIDNRHRGGIFAKTLFSTNTYPNPNKPHGLNNIKNIITRVVDNVFIQIEFFSSYLKAKIINQDGKILSTDELLLS